MTITTKTTTLLDAFRRGIMQQPFDTPQSAVLDFELLAKKYNTTSRTVRRWHSLGVDVEDPLSVAVHIASIQHPAPGAVQAVKDLLKNELATLSK